MNMYPVRFVSLGNRTSEAIPDTVHQVATVGRLTVRPLGESGTGQADILGYEDDRQQRARVQTPGVPRILAIASSHWSSMASSMLYAATYLHPQQEPRQLRVQSMKRMQ